MRNNATRFSCPRTLFPDPGENTPLASAISGFRDSAISGFREVIIVVLFRASKASLQRTVGITAPCVFAPGLHFSRTHRTVEIHLENTISQARKHIFARKFCFKGGDQRQSIRKDRKEEKPLFFELFDTHPWMRTGSFTKGRPLQDP